LKLWVYFFLLSFFAKVICDNLEMSFGECREMNKIIICLNRIYSQIQMLLMQIPSKKKKKKFNQQNYKLKTYCCNVAVYRKLYYFEEKSNFIEDWMTSASSVLFKKIFLGFAFKGESWITIKSSIWQRRKLFLDGSVKKSFIEPDFILKLQIVFRFIFEIC